MDEVCLCMEGVCFHANLCVLLLDSHTITDATLSRQCPIDVLHRCAHRAMRMVMTCTR